jgi:hypothetical protein
MVDRLRGTTSILSTSRSETSSLSIVDSSADYKTRWSLISDPFTRLDPNESTNLPKDPRQSKETRGGSVAKGWDPMDNGNLSRSRIDRVDVLNLLTIVLVVDQVNSPCRSLPPRQDSKRYTVN